jgi:hypothetical protein
MDMKRAERAFFSFSSAAESRSPARSLHLADDPRLNRLRRI